MEKLQEFIELKGKRVILKKLLVSDVTQRYVDWLNNPEVNKYLSVRGQIHNIKNVSEYVSSFERSKDRLLLGIFDKSTKLHIGNITFSSIDWKNEACCIGIAIGDKSYWGKGYASESLSLAIELAFSKLKLHRIEAGVSVNNFASKKLFEKAGFVVEGRLKDREIFDKEYIDVLIYGLINKIGSNSNE